MLQKTRSRQRLTEVSPQAENGSSEASNQCENVDLNPVVRRSVEVSSNGASNIPSKNPNIVKQNQSEKPVDIPVSALGDTKNVALPGAEPPSEVCPPALQKIMDVTEMETNTGQLIVTKTRRFRVPKSKGKRFHSYIALCRRKVNDIGIVVSVNLEVNSPVLRQAFATVLDGIERINLDADPIIIPKPFEVLWYRRARLRDYVEGMVGQPEEQELSKIMEFVDSNLEKDRQEYEKNVSHGKITSDIAWTIFEPGEILVTNTANKLPAQCFQVRDCKKIMGGLEIKCSMWQFNGKAFGTVKRVIKLVLPTNQGSYPITDLPMYPLKFHPEADRLKDRLTKRGHRYAEVVSRSHMNYKSVKKRA